MIARDEANSESPIHALPTYLSMPDGIDKSRETAQGPGAPLLRRDQLSPIADGWKKSENRGRTSHSSSRRSRGCSQRVRSSNNSNSDDRAPPRSDHPSTKSYFYGGPTQLLIVGNLIRKSWQQGLVRTSHDDGPCHGCNPMFLRNENGTGIWNRRRTYEMDSWKLENIGDNAASTGKYDEAITEYSAALSLHPAAPQNFLVKRSKMYLAKDLWEEALNNANKIIVLEPTSPWGYERKYAALLKAGDHENAMVSFETMVSMMSQSSDLEIRERSCKYVNPAQTRAAIREAIQNAIRESPQVLINTDSGHLLDKSGQASSFESSPIFAELVSSMTTHIDYARIDHEVTAYYRYATFSHKWEENEPSYERVTGVIVYDLEEFPTHTKLRMFCKTVQDAGFRWAWSDTCCINKADHFVLQEALMDMFKWYEGSSVTVVYLCDVGTLSQRGDLVKSIWNSRAWTFQEYHASKVVRFYTKGWTPYLNLSILNHKESPEIISEMEEATGVSAQSLMALRPGLDDIREKLRLASTRQTARVEDAAYSLLGIFSMSLPVVYGEGDKALGRLLAQLLTSSGDARILAWTGRPGSFNSCLPGDINVFNEPPTSHTPGVIEDHEMNTIISRSRTCVVNLTSATKLYDRLDELPVPSFAGQRLRLPCITFKLGSVSSSRSHMNVFRAQTSVLGVVEIKAQEDLSRLDTLYLIHPWMDFLLDRQPISNVVETTPEEKTDSQAFAAGELLSYPTPSAYPSTVPHKQTMWLASRFRLLFGGRTDDKDLQDVSSLLPPSTLLETDRQVQALRLVARLQQPFGALLLTPRSGNAYRRVAAESLITVQVEEVTPTVLNKLLDSVRILDVL